jgi:hypothetical protein
VVDDQYVETFSSNIEHVSEGRYVCIPYSSHAQAFRDIKNGVVKYDGAIIDLKSNVERREGVVNYDGYDVINLSKILNPESPLLSISGYDDKIPKVRSLSKPMGAEEVVRNLDKVFRFRP